MPLLELNNQNFDTETERHPMVIIDFWAPWCAPCKAFAPVFEAAAEKYPEILFAKINCDEEQDLARQFEVRSIPTMLAVKDGTIVKVQVGAVAPPKFDEMIQYLRKP